MKEQNCVKKKWWLLLYSFVVLTSAIAQNPFIDSLVQRREENPTLDTSEFKTVDELFWTYSTIDVDEASKYNDTLKMMLNLIQDVAAEPLWYKNKGDLMVNKGEIDQAIIFYDSAKSMMHNLDQAKSFKNLNQITSSINSNYGLALYYKGEHHAALEIFTKIINETDTSLADYPVKLFLAYTHSFAAHMRLGNEAKGFELLLKAASIAEKYDLKEYSAVSALNICSKLDKSIPIETAYKYCVGYTTLIKQTRPSSLGTAYNGYASYLKNKNLLDSSVHYYELALKSEHSTYNTKHYSYFGISEINCINEKYEACKLYADSAMAMIEKSEIIGETEDHRYTTTILQGRALLGLGYPNEAVKILSPWIEKSLDTIGEYNFKLSHLVYLISALTQSSRLVNPELFDRLLTVQDTLTARELRMQSVEVIKALSTTRDSLAIELLTMESRAKESALERRTRALLISIIAGILLAGLFYRSYQLSNQLSNKQKDLETSYANITTLNRELNHRTSNQISLAYDLILDLRRQMGDEQAKALLGRSESQLMALREVNRALADKSDDLVRADEVLIKVAENLQKASPYPFELDMQLEAITLRAREASRAALILSELINNSIKYAFAQQTDNKLSLRATQTNGKTEIIYYDNGPGNDGAIRGTGLGSNLIIDMLANLDAETSFITSPDGSGYGLRWWW